MELDNGNDSSDTRMVRSPSTLNINQIQAEVAPDWQIDPKRLKAVEVVGEGGKILLLIR